MYLFPMRYYKLNEFLLTIAGQWPYAGGIEIIRLLIKFAIICNFVSIIITQIWYIIEIDYEIKAILELMPVFISVLTLLIISSSFYIKINKFDDIWNRMMEDWAGDGLEEEIRIKEIYAENGYYLTKFISIAVLAGLLIFIIGTSYLSKILDMIEPLNETRPPMLPFPIISFMDVEKNFYFLLICQEISVILCITFSIANQTMLCVHMQHIYGMFAVIGYRLQHLLPINFAKSQNISASMIDGICYNSIILCIKRHQKAIEFAKALECYYGPSFVACLLASVFILSPSLLQLADTNLMDYKAVLQVLLIISFLFIISFLGQRLIDLSSDISEKAYCTEWYCCNSHIRKLLILIIRRCAKPCTISAYNLYTLSFDCFRMVMQAGGSFFMMLRELQ